ncbi:L,D-transpeptidase family protein [Geobacter sp. FeAm09]|uniref:L,D-transpeptidase family protein n=1 Tax=Geobacter sp. FeAm09 TaxID=2597769 RepID=UPI0011EF4BCA|nr:L,D-transpeptidase family protein [Geobacter sp. FeAm09]QEM67334.1 L,D-transpeptidase family protein [Geobacter sp. FeAm09]
MRPVVAQSPFLSNCFRLAALWVFIAALQGCAAVKGAQENSWLASGPVEKEVERNRFPVAKGDDVIGRLAAVRLEKGDTLPDVARHFGLGINAISAANPGVDVWAPEVGKRIVLPLSFILPNASRKGIVVNLAAMRLFHYTGEGTSPVVTTYPVGVGTKERPTPQGQMRVERKAARPTWHVPASIAADHRKKGDILPAAVPPGPQNPLGEYALYLSKAGYLIHGTNKPASIGLKATNGCMRLYPENIKALFGDTPVATPVAIVNQPYLIGQRDGVLYLEAHTPLEDSGAGELQKVYERLKIIEKKSGRTLDWEKIRQVQTEARGIPVPIFEMGPGSGGGLPKTVEVEHPATLYGKPEQPELNMAAWYVLAADVHDEIDARRIAAIINHQGPPIPAQVLPKSKSYRVIAGPFGTVGEAREATRRLKMDLDMDGIVIEPVGTL